MEAKSRITKDPWVELGSAKHKQKVASLSNPKKVAHNDKLLAPQIATLCNFFTTPVLETKVANPKCSTCTSTILPIDA